jgi:transposase
MAHPPNIEDMIPEDNICYLVESITSPSIILHCDVQYSGAGHPAYHPAVLLKILIMGIIDRIRSSRRLAKNVRENIVYIYLSKRQHRLRTISDFRKNNAELLKEVFKLTVSFAKEEGLLDLSYLCTDGSKIKANASNKAVMKEGGACFVEEELKQWAERDASEDQAGQDLSDASWVLSGFAAYNVHIASFKFAGLDKPHPGFFH